MPCHAEPSSADAAPLVPRALLARRAAGNVKAAAEFYSSLVQQFPGYIDCYLRLAALARAAGEGAAAQAYVDQATQQAGGDVDAQATLATLHLHRGCAALRRGGGSGGSGSGGGCSDARALQPRLSCCHTRRVATARTHAHAHPHRRRTTAPPQPNHSANQDARECIKRAHAAAPASRDDPYLLLTHANVVLASLRPAPPSALRPEDAKRQAEAVNKVGGARVCGRRVAVLFAGRVV
jgi:hypothetical protein